MTCKIVFFLIVVSVLYSLGGYGQENWELKTEKEGIAIFTRNFPDSKYKGVKVECELDATLSQLVAVILDVNTGADWVYSTKSSILLKQISPSELYYYSEVNIPWPVSNRDFIAMLKVTQDAHTRIVTIDGPTFPDYIPPKKDIVRVNRAEGKWVITPLTRNHIKIEYTLRMDPGGNIPAWLINLFATKGPYESFKNLKRQIQKPAYANAHLPFITD